MSEPEILPPVPALTQQPAMLRASTDEQLIAVWLAGRPKSTQTVYERDAHAMLDYVGRPLRHVVLEDLQAYQASLIDLASGTQARKLKSVKSLFTFGQKTGYLQFNIGAALFLPKVKNTMAERILTERQVILMLEMEKNPRNKVILQTLYFGGLRISELAGLRVRDLRPAENGEGWATIYGKGGKTDFIVLVDTVWTGLEPLIAGKRPEDPVFNSRQQNRALGINMVHRIVKRAAARAGLSEKVSAHWCRHACGSHAIANGADIVLVRDHLRHASIATTNAYVHASPGKSAARFLKR